MFCGRCGSKIREGDVFCTECGKKSEVNQPLPMDASINQGSQSQVAQQSIDVTGKSAMFIAYKLKDGQIIGFFVGLAVWVIFLFVSIAVLAADGNPGMVIFVFVGGCIILLAIFPWELMKHINFLKETNSYDCINDVLSGKVLPDPDTGLSFTNSFLYDKKSGFIAKYDSITNVYVRRIQHSTNGIRTGADEMMIINLINGHQMGIHMRNLSSEEEKDLSLTPLATLIMAEIISRNPNVKLGYEGDK